MALWASCRWAAWPPRRSLRGEATRVRIFFGWRTEWGKHREETRIWCSWTRAWEGATTPATAGTDHSSITLWSWSKRTRPRRGRFLWKMTKVWCYLRLCFSRNKWGNQQIFQLRTGLLFVLLCSHVCMFMCLFLRGTLFEVLCSKLQRTVPLLLVLVQQSRWQSSVYQSWTVSSRLKGFLFYSPIITQRWESYQSWDYTAAPINTSNITKYFFFIVI